MVDRSLDLSIHRLFHLSLGVSPIAAKSDKEHHCEQEEDADHMMHSVAIVEVDDTCFHIVAYVICREDCFAFLGGVSEPCADGIEHRLSFKLPAESAIIDND